MWIIASLLVVVLGVLAYFFWKSKQTDAPPPRSSKTGKPSVAPGKPAAGGNDNWLVAESGELQGKSYHIGKRAITIGRGTQCFVQLRSENASRQHAQIRSTPEGLQLTDMRSANGTFVNGKRIKTHILAEGDKIKIEQEVLVYHLKGTFGKDDGLGRKYAGPTAAAETAYSEGLTADNFVAEMLERTKGNVAEAAKAMGMSEAEYRAVMKSKGFDHLEKK